MKYTKEEIKDMIAQGWSFRNQILRDLDLTCMDMEDADFQGAILINCGFSYSNFGRANFQGATLIDCNLNLVEMRNANLSFSNMYNTTFIGSQLHDACFLSAHGNCISFHKTEIPGGNFTDSIFYNGGFVDTNLEDTDFLGAKLVNLFWVRNNVEGMCDTDMIKDDVREFQGLLDSGLLEGKV